MGLSGELKIINIQNYKFGEELKIIPINTTRLMEHLENVEFDSIYEYDEFLPIPFFEGDILGVFIPRQTKLRVRSEDVDSPINYYLEVADSDTTSPFKVIDPENTESLRSKEYHPLVSVEIDQWKL